MINVKPFNRVVILQKPSKISKIIKFVFSTVTLFVIGYYFFCRRKYRGFLSLELNQWKFFFNLYKEEKNNITTIKK